MTPGIFLGFTWEHVKANSLSFFVFLGLATFHFMVHPAFIHPMSMWSCSVRRGEIKGSQPWESRAMERDLYFPKVKSLPSHSGARARV